jgi:hypothetical protein
LGGRKRALAGGLFPIAAGWIDKAGKAGPTTHEFTTKPDEISRKIKQITEKNVNLIHPAHPTIKF